MSLLQTRGALHAGMASPPSVFLCPHAAALCAVVSTSPKSGQLAGVPTLMRSEWPVKHKRYVLRSFTFRRGIVTSGAAL